MKFNVAFATDDGKTFIGRHFSDALSYDIYELGSKKIDQNADEIICHK